MDALKKGGPGQRTNNLPIAAVVLLVEMRLSRGNESSSNSAEEECVRTRKAVYTRPVKNLHFSRNGKYLRPTAKKNSTRVRFWGFQTFTGVKIQV